MSNVQICKTFQDKKRYSFSSQNLPFRTVYTNKVLNNISEKYLIKWIDITEALFLFSIKQLSAKIIDSFFCNLKLGNVYLSEQDDVRSNISFQLISCLELLCLAICISVSVSIFFPLILGFLIRILI